MRDTVVGPDKEKSVTLTGRTMEWVRDPLDPVIVRLYDPAGVPAEHNRATVFVPPAATPTVSVL